MRNNTIIGLVGTKGSGKTTAARHIVEKLREYNPSIVSFADKLKRTCSEITGQPLENFEEQDKKEQVFEKSEFLYTSQILKILKNFNINSACTDIPEKFSGIIYNTNRQLMQIVGTDMLRSYDDLIHVKTLADHKGLLIVPDVRFANEAEYIIENKGYLIYISNTEAESKVNENSHQSEKEVVEKTRHLANFTVHNDGKNLTKFIENVDDILFDIEYYIKNHS